MLPYGQFFLSFFLSHTQPKVIKLSAASLRDHQTSHLHLPRAIQQLVQSSSPMPCQHLPPLKKGKKKKNILPNQIVCTH